MKPEAFKKEHVNLVKVLKTGSKLEQLKEAAKQSKELKTTVETSKSIRDKFKKKA
jgi:hypothetical protein